MFRCFLFRRKIEFLFSFAGKIQHHWIVFDSQNSNGIISKSVEQSHCSVFNVQYQWNSRINAISVLWPHLNFRNILTVNYTIILTEIDNWTLQTVCKRNENKQIALEVFEIKNASFAGPISTILFYDLFKNSSKTGWSSFLNTIFRWRYLSVMRLCIECVEKVFHFGKAIFGRSYHCW